MLTLVTGKNGSGKSLFAEELAARLGPKRYYLATMRPWGAEGAARVEKHLRQREELNFLTLELPCAVGDAPVPEDGVALLEDVSNLLSNAMFEEDVSEDQVLEDIRSLCGRVRHVVAVTISSFEAGDYSQETRRYIGALRRLNGRLADLADTVVELEAGVPLVRKGGLP